MQPRHIQPKVFKDNDALYRNIYSESAIGLIRRGLGSKKNK